MRFYGWKQSGEVRLQPYEVDEPMPTIAPKNKKLQPHKLHAAEAFLKIQI